MCSLGWALRSEFFFPEFWIRKQIGGHLTGLEENFYNWQNGFLRNWREFISAQSVGSAWQSATLLPISCKSVQPVPVWVEEPVSSVRQSSSSGATNNPPFPKFHFSQHGRVGCQNWLVLPGCIPTQAENTTNNNSQDLDFKQTVEPRANAIGRRNHIYIDGGCGIAKNRLAEEYGIHEVFLNIDHMQFST